MTRWHKRRALFQTTWVLSCSLMTAALILNGGCHSKVATFRDAPKKEDEPSATLGEVCASQAACADEEWCNFLCPMGLGGLDPMCRERPASCNEKNSPVCACDRNVYSSPCEADRAGVGTTYDVKGCTAPKGMYECGNHFCERGVELCFHRYERDWSCHPIAETCDISAPTVDDCFPNSGSVDCWYGVSMYEDESATPVEDFAVHCQNY